MDDNWHILLLALLIDALFGDPPKLYRAIPHPVALIGSLIALGERWLNRGPRAWRLLGGAFLTAALVLLAGTIGGLLTGVLSRIPGGWLLAAVLASTLLAWRSLYDHVKAVAEGLRYDVTAGRAAVAHIVGRDPDSLDAAGVARAAVESAAENFSDGVVAPAFYLLVLGLPGLCAYKAINTLDSMIGHRNARYEAFGKAAARLDDGANWLPARLSGLLLVAAAWLLPGASGARAWRILQRDAHSHRSPNAGWPESAMAGALGFALAGPRRYGQHMVTDNWLGDGNRELTAADIERALRLYCTAGALLLVLAALGAAL